MGPVFDRDDVNNFVAAMAVTYLAGIVSRFTGRRALENTISYCRSLRTHAARIYTAHGDDGSGFLTYVRFCAIIISTGSWMETIFCSPMLFGTDQDVLEQQSDDSYSKVPSVKVPYFLL